MAYFHYLRKPPEPQQGVFMNKVDSGAVQMMVEKQREKMAGLELHEACTTGDYDSLEDYLRSGRFDPNYKDPEWQDRAPVHWACTKGFVDCLRLLLEYKAKSNIRMDMGWTPAHCAAETGKLNILRTLHNAEVPINKKDDYGATPKRIASTYGQWECVKYLQQAENEIKERRKMAGKVEDTESDTSQSDTEQDKS